MGCSTRVTLLVLGYFKLVLIDLLALGIVVMNLVTNPYLLPLYPLITVCVTISIYLSGASSGVALLYGAHKRKPTVLRVFFWYSIIGFILSVLLTSYTLYWDYMTVTSYYGGWHMILHGFDFYLKTVFFGFINLGLQLCIMILVRKEIRKLNIMGRAGDAELRNLGETRVL